MSDNDLIGHSVSDTNGEILTLDEAVADMLQRSRRELIGASYLTITHRHDHARNQDALSNLREDRNRIYIRKRYVKADRSSIWVGLNVSRLHSPSGQGALIATLHRTAPTMDGGDPSITWRAAREQINAIHQRKQLLGEDLFADHAWLILLEIYLAEAEGRSIGLDDLSDCARVTRRTAQRSLDILARRGVVDLVGGDQHSPQLSHTALRQVEELLRTRIDANVA